MTEQTQFEAWIDESPDNAKIFQQEALILKVTHMIWGWMEEKGISRSDLAGRLGRTRGYISQVLAGDKNLTIRTIADIATAMDTQADFSLRPLGGFEAETNVIQFRWNLMPSTTVSVDSTAGALVDGARAA